LQQGKGNVEGGCTLRGCEKKYCKSSWHWWIPFAAMSWNPKIWPCDDVMVLVESGEMMKYGKS
jgi:hypothetical protein